MRDSINHVKFYETTIYTHYLFKEEYFTYWHLVAQGVKAPARQVEAHPLHEAAQAAEFGLQAIAAPKLAPHLVVQPAAGPLHGQLRG